MMVREIIQVPKKQFIKHPIELAFALLTLFFFVITLGFAQVVIDVQSISKDNKVLLQKNAELTKENQHRISDIQKNRIASCALVFDGIYEVFKPFFPNPPKTKKQIRDLKKFKTTINGLKSKCVKQIEAK